MEARENQNTVELLGHYGGDKTHALSAWTSTTRDYEKKKHRMPELLKEKLAPHGHKTPFEKSTLHFLVTTDIATHIHIIKHRIGVSVNAESARYKELKEDKMYLPTDWGDTTVSCDFGIWGGYADAYAGQTKWIDLLIEHTEQGNFFYHQALKDFTKKLGRKRAKETARYFKTYNSQITADVMFNFSSFIHFLNLRYSDHAQKEVQQVAAQMLRLVWEIEGNPFKESLAAYGYDRETVMNQAREKARKVLMMGETSIRPQRKEWYVPKDKELKKGGRVIPQCTQESIINPAQQEKDKEFLENITSPVDTKAGKKKIFRVSKKISDGFDAIQPQYYKSKSGQDVLDVCNDFGCTDMCKATAMKYILRSGKKYPQKEIEDLEKAMEYLKRKIDFLYQGK